MQKKLIAKSLAASLALALVASVNTVPASAADKELVVWADETRGPNLTKTLAAKSDWVSGYKITVKAFSSFDALKEAVDKSTDLTGPDIILGANDWVPTGAKNGKLAPITLPASVKSRFTANQLFDLSYKGNLYGVPLDINNVGMVYNENLVKNAPKTLGEMVSYYKANKDKKGLVAGLCIAGGGTSWGAHSVLSALGGSAYRMKNGAVDTTKDPINPAELAKNIKTYLLDADGKSNGFFPATDTGCKDNYLAGKVPFAIIGNWEWQDYMAQGFQMNLMPVPGVKAGTSGTMFASVSGAMLTSFAAKRGVEAGAKDLLINFFASTAGAVAYQAIELRPPAEKGAQTKVEFTAQQNFGKAASKAGIPQIGAILNGAAGSKSYWDLLPAFWTAVLVNGKDPQTEATKMNGFFVKNVTEGVKDL
jgi:arabinogalactan oligomer / maltooligosaccharide transport system substrate-binding protein